MRAEAEEVPRVVTTEGVGDQVECALHVNLSDVQIAAHSCPQTLPRPGRRQFGGVGRDKPFSRTTGFQYHTHFSTPVVFSHKKEGSDTGFRTHHLHQ